MAIFDLLIPNRKNVTVYQDQWVSYVCWVCHSDVEDWSIEQVNLNCLEGHPSTYDFYGATFPKKNGHNDWDVSARRERND